MEIIQNVVLSAIRAILYSFERLVSRFFISIVTLDILFDHMTFIKHYQRCITYPHCKVILRMFAFGKVERGDCF